MKNIEIANQLIKIAKEIVLDKDDLMKDTEYLYHATYKPLLKSIKKNGLGNTKRTYWQDSVPGVVYLAIDPDIAESYAEENENCNEDWLDEIVVLEVKTKDLDSKKLFVDKNVKLDEGEKPSTFEYHGVIPFNLLKIKQ